MPTGYYVRTKEYREKMSKIAKDRGYGLWSRGRIPAFILRGKHHHPSGEKCSKWKGGVTSENKKVRMGREFIEWRRRIFEKDEYTCQGCGERGYIEPHHLCSFSEYPQYRFEDWNGQTLCRDCHVALHWG